MRLRLFCLLLLFMVLLIDATEQRENPPAAQKDVREVQMTTEAGSRYTTKNPKNIFIYNPHIGYHHVHFMATIANTLADAGHNVTMLDSLVYTDIREPYINVSIQRFTVKQNKKTAVTVEGGETKAAGLRSFWPDTSTETKVKGFFSFYNRINNFGKMMSHQCEDVFDALNSDEFRKLRGTTFDLAITEVFDFCGVGLSHYLNIKKTILASSVPLHEYIGEKLGLPKSFDIVPTKFSMRTAPEHRESFKEYTISGFSQNVIESATFGQSMFGYLEVDETKVFKKKINEFPGFEELLRRSHSLIENVHPLLDLNKPTLNAIIPIGGITVNMAGTTQYPAEQQTVLNEIKLKISEAKNKQRKVVLVSFGTVMKTNTMGAQTKENLVKAFTHLGHIEFIWYAKRSDLASRIPDNVHIFDWLPQAELLASGNIDLFVSHMGIGSMTEAAYCGVPMVAIPIFVDQHYNYVCAKRLGIADFLDKTSLETTYKEFSDAIEKALLNEETKKISNQLRNNIEKFGDQKKRMMEHINFILSLPENSASIAFRNHHHGLNLMLSVQSLLHLVPYYAMPITSAFIIVFYICLAFLSSFCYRMLKNKMQKKTRDEPAVMQTTDESAVRARKTDLSLGTVTFCSILAYVVLTALLYVSSDYFPSIAKFLCPVITYVVTDFLFKASIFATAIIAVFLINYLCVHYLNCPDFVCFIFCHIDYFNLKVRAVYEFTFAFLITLSFILVLSSFAAKALPLVPS